MQTTSQTGQRTLRIDALGQKKTKLSLAALFFGKQSKDQHVQSITQYVIHTGTWGPLFSPVRSFSGYYSPLFNLCAKSHSVEPCRQSVCITHINKFVYEVGATNLLASYLLSKAASDFGEEKYRRRRANRKAYAL